ncbi:MAG TPA: DNA-binding protein [Alphaproteobacteria bacterium]|nr:DNA-binding protein [Alphaproteobacteria bacterium]
MDEDAKVYRVPEFCRRYAISRRSLYREIAAGRLCIYKRGRRTLIAHGDAEMWHESERKNHPLIKSI